MSPPTVLITGPCGFLGGRFLDVLTHAAPRPEVVGWRRALDPPSGAPREIVDDLSATSLADVLAELRPAHLVHLAGLVPPADDAALWTANVGLASILLDAVRIASPHTRVLLIGSAAEYGPARIPRIGEDQPCAPTTTYGRAKLCQTLLARHYHRSWGVPVMIARPFNVIGPGMSSCTVVGAICEQLAAARADGVVKLGNLDSARDFLDVRDVAAACWQIARRGAPGQVYNVCRGEAHTIRDVAALAIAISGIRVTVKSDAARFKAGDFDYSCGDGA
jgi:GDP-4-dehydro-6-deoxy-D-mannose reductase